MKIGTFLSDPVGINLPGAPGVPGVPSASPNDFGASVGAATQQAGQQLIRSGVVLGDINRRLEAEATAERNKKIAADTASMRGQWDFSADFIDATTKAGERPEDFGTTIGNMYDTKRDAFLDKIQDNDVRRETKKALDLERDNYIKRANEFQAKAGASASVRDANDGINVQVNSVRTDPSFANFQTASQKIDDIVANRPGLTADVRASMRQNAQHLLARRRFEAMIESSALDPTALDGVTKELEQPQWREKLSNGDYDKLRDSLTTLTKAANSQEVALAKSSLHTLKQRNEDPAVLISDDEMSAAKAVVVKSGRPELMTEFAKIQQTQNIYKEFQGLPLQEMRAKVEELRKRGGITGLPETLQNAINAGSSITNGKTSASYLAGLVNAEYSAKDIAAGNFGVVTGNTLPDGRRASDATGLAQFIGPTWRETLRKHADTLGIDPSKSDAELDAMRKDPVLSLKAAALHAQDNAVILRSALGREPSDTDLYFAHFLGAGGAVRFLKGYAANPNIAVTSIVDNAQTEANRPVFYDASGRPRTAAQVAVYVTDKMANGPSVVDYAGVRAGEKYLSYVQKELHDDPVTYGKVTKRFGDMGNMETPEGIAARGVAINAMASYYGVPIKPLSKAEVEVFGAQIRDGDAEAKMAVLSKTAQLDSPATIAAANKQLGEKDSLFGFAADAVVARPDMKGVALDVFRGETRLKNDKDAKTLTDGNTDATILSVWNATVGKAVLASKEATATLRSAALAYYYERSVVRGNVQPNSFNADAFKEAIYAVLGGTANPGGNPLANVNGGIMILPPKHTEATFNQALRRATQDDYAALSMSATVPRYLDGKVITPEEIARSGQFESVGKGHYKIKMGDGRYAVTAAYKDGSTDDYIFHGDPDRLLEMANRTPNAAPLPTPVRGVQPAQPRVIQ